MCRKLRIAFSTKSKNEQLTISNEQLAVRNEECQNEPLRRKFAANFFAPLLAGKLMMNFTAPLLSGFPDNRGFL
jgi:hypothetical protein